jgi:hypothetical protein
MTRVPCSFHTKEPNLVERSPQHYTRAIKWWFHRRFFLWIKLCCMSDCCVLFWLVYIFVLNMYFIHIAHALNFRYGLMPLCITCFNFWEHIKASKLGGGIMIYPMTIGLGPGSWNTQLGSKWLLGNSGHTRLNHFLQCSYTVLTRTTTR